METELRLWEEPLYRLIIQVTIAQILFLGLIIAGIISIRGLRLLREKKKEQISSDLFTPLMNFLSGDIPLEVATDLAKKYPRTSVCRELERYTIMLGGDSLARIRALYEELNLRTYGIKLSRSILWWRRLEGIRLLGAAGGHDVVDVLLDGLSDKQAIVRLAAARSLGKIKHPKSIEPILRLMASTKQGSRRQLAQTLVAFGPAAYPALRTLIRQETEGEADAKTICTTLEMLALTGDIESAHEIRSLLTSANTEIRIAAFKAAVLLHIPLSTEDLEAGLADSEWPVRAQAAIASGKIGDASIIEKLGACLADSNWWVRNNAGEALAKLGFPGVKELERIYHESDDAFARDMAARTLTSDPSSHFVPKSPGPKGNEKDENADLPSENSKTHHPQPVNN